MTEISKDLLKMQQLKTVNYSERENDIIDMVIIHYTEVDLNETIEIFQNPKREVSAHYVISQEGDLFQFVDEAYKAWHAGQSYWRGRDNINDYSIGIELVNDGISEYSDRQMAVLLSLLADIKIRYKINPLNILGHSDISPLRKNDPGKRFPWPLLSKMNLSYYPNVNLVDNLLKKKEYEKQHICQKLAKIGYYIADNISDDELALIIARFCQRYAQDIYTKIWNEQLEMVADQLLLEMANNYS